MGRHDHSRGFSAWASFCGPGGFGFGRPVGVRSRIFDRGDLKYVILRLLRERPMHGYEVMRALEEESCGCYTASPGSVYPTLQMLEDQGYVASETRDGKKTYSITDEGRAFLEENKDRLEDILDRIAEFTRHFTGAAMADATRSFVRLAQVSFERASRSPGGPEAMSKLTEILERAAREVENLGRAGRDGDEEDETDERGT
ncbi:MAG: PadR family transcriptional regulator [Gemmatimonadota bacterium]